MIAPPPLSKQEWLTLCCWIGGMSAAQTAYTLGIGAETVKEYRQRIRRKTNEQNPHLNGRIPAHA